MPSIRSIVYRRLRPWARLLPSAVQDRLRRIWWKHVIPATTAATADADTAGSYATRLQAEQDIFADQEEIHDLPRIFHYWSHTYLRPKLETFGCSNPDEFFANELQKAVADASQHPARFVSLGAGNCDTEVRVARILVDRGVSGFVIECLDINEATLERGRAHARNAGVEAQITPLRGDFNDWKPIGTYDAVMANQSLHHVVNLEGLFDATIVALAPHGRFVISDMIGRNGHERWPEAAAIVREFWQELPESYRYHTQLRRQENEFIDWDCSVAGFEGVRAQDILPLLIERFEFEMFLGFANVIDPFIDRGFGPNFDAEAAFDRDLIDRIHARDEEEMAAGRITPTHMMAVLRKRPFATPVRYLGNLTPQFCVRRTRSGQA